MSEKIWLSSPHMGENELKYVQQAFADNWIAPAGPYLKTFEEKINQYFNVEASTAVSSGTAALHLALINLNIGIGDTVLVQSMTFAASANPVVYLGAEPVFIDSEKDTYNLDPNCVREAIEDLSSKGKKPKAIIIVHLYGMPAKMAELEEIANEYNIPLIEDAAEAAGSTYFGKKCGGFGKMAILSFNGNKIITTSGGGALLSDDPSLIDQARFLSTQAKDDAPHYQHSQIGYNYRMSNVCAGIGVGQMEILDTRVAQRRANFEFYRKHLADYSGVDFLEEPQGCFSNRWLTTITVDPSKTNGVTREDIRLALDAENIESRPLWKPLHMQPVFKEALYYGNKVSEELFDNGLCLPSGSNLIESDLDRIVTIIKKTLESNN